jgi:hypothetical protein
MRNKTYRVHYVRSTAGGGLLHEDFTKPFLPEHFAEIAGEGFPGLLKFSPETGMPRLAALAAVNKWNRQNAGSGFTYWVE